jgi:hypothetical protein
MDLSIERWESVTPTEREEIANRLEKELPLGFTFQCIRHCRLGAVQNHIAFFQKDGAFFVFVPGSEVSLGYDRDRPWEPNQDELESWQETAEEYGIAETIQEHVASVTLSVRRVKLAPFLIETVAEEPGWESIGVDDPEVQEILREHAMDKHVEAIRGNTHTRVKRDRDGSVIAERALALTHADLTAQMRATGFRFPTSDEWEYACGGGASTLFRWGDHVPCDRYPTDVSPAEANWRRQWVLSAGELEYPPEGFTSDWDHHRQPNGFGLFIASNPYKCELVAETGITRGGDGGCNICGGAGFFIGWLTLATAYFEEDFCKHDPSEPISHGYTVGRKVLELR